MIKINNNLDELRSSIDNINNKIASLIAKRIELVKEVGKIKKHKNNSYYVPEREKFIFENLSKTFPELDKNIIKNIFTEIISGCRSYEKIFKVGILEDVYSLTAVQKILGSFTDTHIFKSCKDIKSAYNSLDYVLIPLDVNLVNFVENLKDIFIINYSICFDKKFLLLGKTQNSNIDDGYYGFISEKNNFAKIKDRLYNHLYNIYEISDSQIFIEIKFSKNNKDEIKKILSASNIFLGAYPYNNF